MSSTHVTIGALMTAEHPRILVCFDGASHSLDAIDHIQRLCPSATLDILVVDDAHSESAAQASADRGAAFARDRGFVAHTLVRSGDHVAQVILDTADPSTYDAVLLGTRVGAGLEAAVLRSIPSAVSMHARIPVILDRAHVPHAPDTFTDAEIDAQLPAISGR